VTREPLDSRSLQHILPTTPEPTFLTNPPTSGPHRPGLHPQGVLTQPIDKGVQVSMLEGGQILIQYKDLSTKDRAKVEALAGGPVSVAPNPELPAKVVATAWMAKVICSGVDSDALVKFAARFQGKGAGHA
jgi:hypothetical protein